MKGLGRTLIISWMRVYGWNWHHISGAENGGLNSLIIRVTSGTGVLAPGLSPLYTIMEAFTETPRRCGHDEDVNLFSVVSGSRALRFK